jgi:O-antigen/teichoic acid export membrane protein
VALAFVPVYVKILGIEAYGLVAVYTTLRNLFVVLDLGLTTTLNRELARRSRVEGRDTRDLVRTLESIYWGLAVLIALSCVALGPWLAREFVHAQTMARARVEAVVRLMGVVIAFEWLLTFYAGGLMGLHRQVLYNACYAALSILRFVGVLPVLWYVSPSIEAFFAWQAAAGLLGALVLGTVLWRALPPGGPARFRTAVVRSIWHFAAGTSAVALTGLLLSQLDRVILARLVPLSELGYYGLSLTFAGALYGLINPIYGAVFPRLSASVATQDRPGLTAQYHRACQLMSVTILPAAAVICFFSPEILRLWTRDPVVVDRTHLLLRVMIVSAALNGLLTVPHSLLLAHGNTRITFWMNVIAIAVLTPVTVWSAQRFGVLGATVGWAAYNALNVVIGMHFVHRLVLPAEGRRWYAHDVGRPAAIAVSMAAAGRLLLPSSLPAGALALAIGLLLGLGTLATARVAPEVWRSWRTFLGRVGGGGREGRA